MGNPLAHFLAYLLPSLKLVLLRMKSNLTFFFFVLFYKKYFEMRTEKFNSTCYLNINELDKIKKTVV